MVNQVLLVPEVIVVPKVCVVLQDHLVPKA